LTDSNGEYEFTELAPGTYTISEQLQVGWTQTAGGTTFTLDSGQEVVAYLGQADPLLDGQIEVLIDGLAFGNFLQTSIHGYKFHDLNGNGLDDGEPRLEGWTIVLVGTDGMGNAVSDSTLTDSNGEYEFTELAPGTYTISEQLQVGWTQTAGGTTFTLDSGQEVVAYLGQADPLLPGQTEVLTAGLALGNHFRRVIVIGEDKNPHTPQTVRVIDQVTGDVLAQFAPYGNTFQGGVRIATGDLTGDGVDEIVTAPGWSIVAEIHVYTQDGILLTSFQPYGPTFNGGVHVAVADVDGDGLNDIITVPNWGPAEVKVFRNVLVGGVPTFDAANPYRHFLAFPASFIGGAVVAAADMGSTPVINGPFDNTQRDQQAEIVVGSGAGMQTTVKVFDVSSLATLTPGVMPTAAGSFTPFSTATTVYRGGVFLDVARINADPIPDIIVGAGVLGGSLVDVWAWDNTSSAMLSSLSANGLGFEAFDGPSRNSPVRVAGLDTNGDDIADAILAVQGPGGTTGQIRVFNITNVSPLEVALPFTTVPGGFADAYFHPYFIATISDSSPVLPEASGEGGILHAYAHPYDVNGDDRVTPVDVLILINYINGNPDGHVTPLNVLVVINYINSELQGPAGEGESVTMATSTSEIPVVSAGFALPAMESHWVDAEPSAFASSVGQVDNGLPGVWSMPDTGAGSLPERGLVTQARDRDRSVDLDTDLFELDSMLDDMVLDIARSWNRSA